MARTSQSPFELNRLLPRQKVWFQYRGSFLMGPNYLRFLQAVQETGTLRESGKAVGWSYRTCLNARILRSTSAIVESRQIPCLRLVISSTATIRSELPTRSPGWGEGRRRRLLCGRSGA